MEAPEQHHEAEGAHAPAEVLPLNRIKRLMKEEADVKAVSAEASYAAARATELLIEEMAVRAFQLTHAEQRDTVSYGDVASSVAEWAPTQFLRDIVPPRVALSEIIKRLHTEELEQQQQQKLAQQQAPSPQQQAAPQEQAPQRQQAQPPPAAQPVPPQPQAQPPQELAAAPQPLPTEAAAERPTPVANGDMPAPEQNGSPMQVDHQQPPAQPAAHALPDGGQQLYQPPL